MAVPLLCPPLNTICMSFAMTNDSCPTTAYVEPPVLPEKSGSNKEAKSGSNKEAKVGSNKE